MLGFSYVFCHMNPNRIFHIKYCLSIYIKYKRPVNEYFADNFLKRTRAHLFAHSQLVARLIM